jgi:hypothetical protein
MTDTYYLDWSDFKHVTPGELPPYGFRELVAGSGVAVPDPNTNHIHPGWFTPNRMPANPIDLAGMQIRAPGELGPYGYKELIPRSGVFIAPNTIAPGEPAKPPKLPLDMGRIKFYPPGQLPPYGYAELIPGTGVCLPVKDMPARGGTYPAAHHSTDDAAVAGPASNKVFEVDFRQLEGYAKTHDLSTEEIARWVQADPGLPERFLQTHGKVAYATYLKIKEYADSRQVQGTIYAHRNASTAEALRNAVRVIDGVDTDNANRLNVNRPTVT